MSASPITRKSVAAHANVSETTVSFVISGKWREHGISAATCERVMTAAKELGYQPNRAARELRGARTGRVALVLRALDRPFYAPLLEAFHQEALSRGYALLVFLQRGNEPPDALVKEAFSQTDAVFVGGECSATFAAQIQGTRAKPLVFMNHRSVDGHFTIVTDPARQVHTATKHLIDQGYRSLYFASGNPDRTPGFRRALEEAGMEFTDANLVAHGSFDFSHGERLAEEVTIEPEGATGIVAANDAVAIGCMHCLSQQGLRAGRDYGIVGFDNIEVGAYLTVPLTTVSHDYHEKAVQAFSLAESSYVPPTVVHLESRLLVRSSTCRS